MITISATKGNYDAEFDYAAAIGEEGTSYFVKSAAFESSPVIFVEGETISTLLTSGESIPEGSIRLYHHDVSDCDILFSSSNISDSKRIVLSTVSITEVEPSKFLVKATIPDAESAKDFTKLVIAYVTNPEASVSYNIRNVTIVSAPDNVPLVFCGRNIEDFDNLINGTAKSDTLKGTKADDLIRGYGGDDTLDGKGGNDCIAGNGGDDILYGGRGGDAIYGGEGDDQIYGRDGDDVLYGNQGDDLISGGGGDDYIAGWIGNDDIFGNIGNDKLFGNEGDDFLKGGDGDDIMFGGNGDDRLVGNTGADRISGQGGDDVILGGRGNDRLRGGEGSDALDGGRNRDICYDDDDDQIISSLVNCEEFQLEFKVDSNLERETEEQEPEFQTPVNLSESGRDALYSQVAAQDGGNVYAVWMEDTGVGSNDNHAFSTYDIFFRASHDGGNSFGPKVNLSNDTLPALPPVVAASGDHVFVMWTEPEPIANNERLFFRASHDKGLTFDEIKELTREDESAFRFEMTATDDGRIYVVYESSFEGGVHAIFRSSHDYGVNFGQHLAYFSPECIVSGIDVIASPEDSDDVYVTTGDTCAEQGGNEVLFRASHDGGQSFAPIIRMGLGQGHQLAASGSDNVYVTWQDNYGSVVIAASNDAGVTFDQPIILAEAKDITNAVPEIIAINASVYVIWHGNVVKQLTPEQIRDSGMTNQTTEIDINTVLFFRASVDNGASYGRLVQLTSLEEYAYWPQIGAVGNTLAIVWANVSSTASSGSQIFYVDSNDQGNSFSDRHMIEQATGDLLGFVQPQVAIADNSEYVTWWQGNFPNSFEVHIARKAI